MWGPPWHCQAPLGHPSCWQPVESLLSTQPYVLPTPCNSISITQWKNSFCAKKLRFFQTITLSRTPPTGSTRPCKEISPVIAWIIVKGNGFRFWAITHAIRKSKAQDLKKTNMQFFNKKLTRSVRTSRPVRRLTSVVAIVTPALGPSFVRIQIRKALSTWIYEKMCSSRTILFKDDLGDLSDSEWCVWASKFRLRLSLLKTFSTAPAGKCRCRSLPLTRLCPSNPSRSAWLLVILDSRNCFAVILSIVQYPKLWKKPDPWKSKLCRFPHNRSKLRFE